MQERIAVDTAVHFGQPCVAGTRVPVYAVLELVEAAIPFEKIVGHYYPDLTVEDIKACVRYAVDLIRSEEIHVAERQAS